MAVAVHSAEKAKEEAVIYHGANWLQFGPGVITNCTVARLRLGQTLDSVMITDPEKIAEVRRWTVRNVAGRFDLSPAEPIETDGKLVPSLSLYTWRTRLSQPRWDFSCTPPVFLAPRVYVDEALLLYIPLLPGVLGLSEKECAAEIEELAKLVAIESR